MHSKKIAHQLRKVSSTGFEPETFGSGGRRSLQLSYEDVSHNGVVDLDLNVLKPRLSNTTVWVPSHGSKRPRDSDFDSPVFMP